MIARRRLIFILFITISVSIIYLIYNLNESNILHVSIKNPIPEEGVLQTGVNNPTDRVTEYYLIGKKSKTKTNIVTICEELKLSYVTKEKLEVDDYDKDVVFIFCDEEIDKLADLEKLVLFVEGGGKIMLAHGIAEGYTDAYLQPVLGIVEKSKRENYNEYNIAKGFLPVTNMEMSYSGYTMSTWIKVRKEATSYVTDKSKQVPIIYKYPYQKGMCMVINTNFLEDEKCSGFFVSALGELQEDLIYPVIGVKCIFLDNFPVVTYVNDEISLKLYGRTTESFVRDTLWPVFQGISVRNQLKYSSSILAIANSKKVFPEINDSLFYTMGKSAMQFEGEVIYAADMVPNQKVVFNQVFLENFKETFPQYHMNALAVNAGDFSTMDYEFLKKEFAEVEVIRGYRYITGERDSFYCDFGKKDSYYTFGVLTEGTKINDEMKFDVASGLSMYGVFSHRFNINEFITTDETNATWEKNRKALEKFERDYLTQTEWLDACTLSGTKNRLNSYSNLTYQWKKTQAGGTLLCDSFIDGQTFFIKTDHIINSVEGAEYQEVSEGYYLLRIKNSVVNIEWMK